VGLQHCVSCIRGYCGEIPDADDEEGRKVRISFQLCSAQLPPKGIQEPELTTHILREEGERGGLAPFLDRQFIASF
jgi:hypothetical protein